MNIRLQLIALALVCAAPVVAQNPTTAQDPEAAYTRTIHDRADRIVATLELTDSNQVVRVADMIAEQYRHLRDIHDARDAALKDAKEQGGDQEAVGRRVEVIQADTAAKLGKLHKAYLAQLSHELTPKQVEKVKDGMTYDVRTVTYNAYLKMFPELKDHQKAQIQDWLIQAREIAMDAGTSQEKHAIFGKCKGRINNYLSVAGYDLKKGEENLRK